MMKNLKVGEQEQEQKRMQKRTSDHPLFFPKVEQKRLLQQVEMLQQQLQQTSQQKESLQEEVKLAHSIIKEEDRNRKRLLTTLDGIERELR